MSPLPPANIIIYLRHVTRQPLYILFSSFFPLSSFFFLIIINTRSRILRTVITNDDEYQCESWNKNKFSSRYVSSSSWWLFFLKVLNKSRVQNHRQTICDDDETPDNFWMNHSFIHSFQSLFYFSFPPSFGIFFFFLRNVFTVLKYLGNLQNISFFF